MKYAFLLLTVCLFFISCKKHTSDVNSLWPCDIINDDSTSIASQIVGSWSWNRYACSTGNLMMAVKDIKITLDSNATFIILEDSSVIAQGTWKLKNSVSNQWELDLSSPSEYLKGFIMFCNNQVAFIDSYEDGRNHYFEQKK